MTTSHDDIMRALGNIEAKLDGVIGVKADHEHRLRAIEKTKWVAHGFAAAIGAGVSSAIAVFFTILKGHQ